MMTLAVSGELILLGALGIASPSIEGFCIYGLSLALIIVHRALRRPYRRFVEASSRPAGALLEVGLYAAILGSCMAMLALLEPAFRETGTLGVLALGSSLLLGSGGVWNVRLILRPLEAEAVLSIPRGLKATAVLGGVTGLSSALLAVLALLGTQASHLTLSSLLVTWIGVISYGPLIHQFGRPTAVSR